MAERRMLAKTIIRSDAFLEMPTSSQLLFFHLALEASCNGVLNNAKSICKLVGCDINDLIVLQNRGFISRDTEGLYVVNNWDAVVGRGETAKKRITYRYRKWRESVLLSDSYTCQSCGSIQNLEAHHIKSFAEHESERYKTENGTTLCKECHMALHAKERSDNG